MKDIKQCQILANRREPNLWRRNLGQTFRSPNPFDDYSWLCEKPRENELETAFVITNKRNYEVVIICL